MENGKISNSTHSSSREVKNCMPVDPMTLSPLGQLKSIDEMIVA